MERHPEPVPVQVDRRGNRPALPFRGFRRPRTPCPERGPQQDHEPFQSPPQTLQRAVEHLQSALPLKDRVFIANAEEKDLHLIRLTFGAHIRDECGLPTGNPELVRSCARFTGKQGLTADAAIDVLIEALWKTLRQTHSIRVVKTEGSP